MNKWQVMYPDETGISRVVGTFKSRKAARQFASSLMDQKLPFPIIPFINDHYTPVIKRVGGSRGDTVQRGEAADRRGVE